MCVKKIVELRKRIGETYNKKDWGKSLNILYY